MGGLASGAGAPASGALAFDRAFTPAYGEAVSLAPGLARLTAPNPGPFTFAGTNTYLLGTAALAIVDPGPDDAVHLAALLAAVAGRPVAAILLTHTHPDHAALAPRLRALTGAPVMAGARAGADGAALPTADETLADGRRLAVSDMPVEVVATPGHASDHLAFALGGGAGLLSGDHVMAWSTTVIAPPDGAMAPYRRSLARCLERPEAIYWPGHGGPVRHPQPFLRGLIAHRSLRERAILARLAAGDRTIPAIVAALYAGTDPALHGAAGLSVLAHLEDLAARGQVAAEGPAALGARYRLA